MRKTPHPLGIKTVIQDDIAGVAASGALTNIFGGAEKLSVSVARDSTPRALTSWYVDFSAPIQASPDLQAHVSAFVQKKENSWASHQSALQGVSAKVVSASALYPGSFFEAGIESVQRSVTGVSEDASDSIKSLENSTSQKTALFSRFAIDRRDNPVYPTSGYFVDIQSEVAGVFGGDLLKSDVSYLKTLGSASYSKSLDPSSNNLVISASVGSGLLWTYNSSHAGPNTSSSSIHDRFFLGGKSSGLSGLLYGYKFNGLGPKDGFDSVGGDAFTLGNISVVGKLPRLASSHPLSPLRFLLFFSGASLVPVTHSGGAKGLRDSLFSEPSTSAGAGLLYKAGAADLELVYGVPLHSRDEDWSRKGLQVSVGFEL